MSGFSITIAGALGVIIHGSITLTNLGPATETQYAPVGVVIAEGIPVESVVQLKGTCTYRAVAGPGSITLVNSKVPSQTDVDDWQAAERLMTIYNRAEGIDCMMSE